jgi:hypothetical protein
LALTVACVVAGIGVTTNPPAVCAAPALPTTVKVLLPAGYAQGGRWPVVYVLNCVPCDRILPVLARQPFITVAETTPRALDDYATRADGTRDNVRIYARRLTAWTDSHYRTIPTRAGRAITGISAGGYGALLLAARDPGRFGHVAGFSAIADIRGTNDQLEPTFYATASSGATPDDGAWGRPYADGGWAENNPADLGRNLRGTSIYFGSGNGSLCAGETSTSGQVIERIVRQSQDSFARALRREDVRFTQQRLACGAHDQSTWLAEVEHWLATRPFDTTPRVPPRHVDWAPHFAARHWMVRVDPERGLEPMLLSCRAHRLTLRGSGRTRLTSGRLGRPHARVAVRIDGRSHRLRLNRTGQLRVVVRLGGADRGAGSSELPTPGTVRIDGHEGTVRGSALRC